MMPRFAPILITIAAVAALGTGCATYTAQNKGVSQAIASGNTQAAADAFGKRADESDKNNKKDMVVLHLEAGAAYRSAGDLAKSNRHLENAGTQIDTFEEQAKHKVGLEFLGLMTNQQNLPYEGCAYDKIMLYTYRTLNYLAMGEVDKARPEIIHAYQCQQDAVEENKLRIEKAQDAEKKSKDRATIERSKADPTFNKRMEGVTKDLEGFKFYADYVNPFTVYLDGLYFLYAGTGASDLERARKSFNRVKETTGENKVIQSDLERAENGGNDHPTPCTYVIFETGQAASRDQIRIDIPIVVVNVSYVGAAFPKLVFHQDYASHLTVKSGAAEEKTVVIANMDSIIALDFKNEWPVILTKTLMSTVAKAAATYGINKAAEQNAYANLASKLFTTVAGVALNIADTRSWTTLPKEFQVARIPTPADRKLTLSTPGAAPVDVTIADGIINIVYVKSVVANSPLAVSQFKLK